MAKLCHNFEYEKKFWRFAMPKIEPISILRERETLDRLSQDKEPLFVTKNGSSYLVILSPDSYDEIIKERDHYKKAFEREQEINKLIQKVKASCSQIEKGESYSEEEFDKILESIL